MLFIYMPKTMMNKNHLWNIIYKTFLKPAHVASLENALFKILPQFFYKKKIICRLGLYLVIKVRCPVNAIVTPTHRLMMKDRQHNGELKITKPWWWHFDIILCFHHHPFELSPSWFHYFDFYHCTFNFT